jgi:hypothetical protein
VQEIKGHRSLGIFLLIFSLFWGGLPTFFFVQSIADGTFEAGMLMILVFTVAGLGLFLFGLNQFFIKGKLRITKDEIEFEKRGLFGRKQWREPMASYEGILSRSEYHSGSKNSPSYTLYIVELYHPEKKKRIKLYQSRSEMGFRAKWEEHCRAMNLPAVEDGEGGLIRRNVEDLDKSVRELRKENKIEVKFDPNEDPPEGLDLSVNEDQLLVTQNQSMMTPVGFLIMLLFPGIFIYVGFFLEDCPVFFGIVGVFLELVFLAVGAWLLITRPQVRLTRDDVHLLRLTPWGETHGVHIRADDIEQVVVKKDEKTHRKAVVITTDDQQKAFGEGLSAEGLEWLKNCILTVVSA